MKKHRTSRRLAVLLRRIAMVGVAIIVALVLKSVQWAVLNVPPAGRIDAPVVAPSPNGYDYYLKAEQIVAGPGGDAIDNNYRGFKDTCRPTLVQAEAAVAPNFAALKAVDEGLKYPVVVPPTRLTIDGQSAELPARRLCQLLEMDAALSELRKDWTGAAAKWLRVMAFSDPLVDMYHGTLAFSDEPRYTAGQALLRIIPHLDAANTRKTLAGIIRERNVVMPLDLILRRQKHEGEQDLLVLFHDRNWRRRLAEKLCVNDGRIVTEYAGYPAWLLTARLLMQSDRAYMRQYDMGAAAEVSGNEMVLLSHKIIDWDNPVLRPLWPCWSNNGGLYYLDAASIATALRAYHFDHSSYPTTLAQLTPAYFPTVQKSPVQYRRYDYVPVVTPGTKAATGWSLVAWTTCSDATHTWIDKTVVCTSP